MRVTFPIQPGGSNNITLMLEKSSQQRRETWQGPEQQITPQLQTPIQS